MLAKLNDNLEIYYEITGSGPLDILFIHGLGTTGKSWQRLVPLLSAHHTCITVDLPGYGRSSQDDFPFSPSFFAECLASFIEFLKLKDVVLAGHSMGGQIALHLALSNPEKVRCLLLFAPAGFETFTKEGKALISQWYTPEILQNISPAQVRRNFEANFYHPPAQMEEMIAERLAMMETPAYRHFSNMVPRCVRGMLDEPVFDQLQNIEIPVLTFFGREDNLIPSPLLRRKTSTYDIAQKANKKLRNGELVMLEKCGHFIPMERPDKLIDKCLSFLKNATD